MFRICTSQSIVRTSILTALALIFIVTGCGTSQNKGINSTPSPQNSIVIFPSCRQTSCITPTNGTVSSGIPGVRPFINTAYNIHLFLSFDYKIPQPAAIASHYDFVWGADVDNVSAFRSGNPNMFITYYIPFNRDSGTFTDQNAYHDLNYWKSVHPDWILYKCDRVTPAYVDGEPNIPFDFTNPDVISWQVKTYAQPASMHGYDGLDADNLNLENLTGACGSYKNGVWVQRYTGQVDDQQWISDAITWLTRMQQALHSLPHPLALIPNLSLAPLTPDDPQIQELLKHIDGVLDEGGFTQYSQGYLTDEKWVQHIKFIQTVQAMNKPFYIVNQFPPPSVSTGEIQWALSSYLMSKENLSAVFISLRQAYGGDTRYAEYNAPIGKPINEMYLAQNVFWRDYSNGRVVVNPSSVSTYTVSLNVPSGHFVDLYGDHIGQRITLPPHSGIVLLNS
ncbi:MAG: putative glycoside hydrolase [Ktedonobacteraceae bacterium]